MVSGFSNFQDEMLSGAVIFNIKHLIGRVNSNLIIRSSKNLSFLMQTIDHIFCPFITAFVDNKWRSTTPEETLKLLMMMLRVRTEIKLKRRIKDIVLTILEWFNRFKLSSIEQICIIKGLHVIKLMIKLATVALLYTH